ncbi:hypothetical protein V8C42DRAFT_8843 [Trichoderma barbatum]
MFLFIYLLSLSWTAHMREMEGKGGRLEERGLLRLGKLGDGTLGGNYYTTHQKRPGKDMDLVFCFFFFLFLLFFTFFFFFFLFLCRCMKYRWTNIGFNRGQKGGTIFFLLPHEQNIMFVVCNEFPFLLARLCSNDGENLEEKKKKKERALFRIKTSVDMQKVWCEMKFVYRVEGYRFSSSMSFSIPDGLFLGSSSFQIIVK